MEDNSEIMFANRISGGRFYGEYQAEVTDNDDPLKLLRVQVRVSGVHPSDYGAGFCPWAEIKLPIGARAGEGTHIPLEGGDWVWVDFPYNGDPRRPRITGSVHYCPDKVPNLPPEAFAGLEATDYLRTQEEGDAPVHEYNRDVVFSKYGTIVEIRRDGSVGIINRKSKSEIGINKKGVPFIHSATEVILTGNKSVSIKAFGGPVSVTSSRDVRVVAAKDVAIETNTGDINIGSTVGDVYLSSKTGKTLIGAVTKLTKATAQPAILGNNMVKCIKALQKAIKDTAASVEDLASAVDTNLKIVAAGGATAGAIGDAGAAMQLGATAFTLANTALALKRAAIPLQITKDEAMFLDAPVTGIKSESAKVGI